MATKYYTLVVEAAINNSPVYEGKFNKQMEWPDGDPVPVKLMLGAFSFSNYSRVWAKRLKEPKTLRPTGQLEFLPWGEEGGEVVEIRYLSTSQSLDKQYQINVEKNLGTDEDVEMKLDIGNNDFDVDISKVKIEFLKHHSWNGDNKSRNPDISTVMFYELKPGADLKSRMAEVKRRNEAEKVVLDALDNGSLIALANIFGEDPKTEDGYLQTLLMNKVDANHEVFLKILDDAKKDILGGLENAEELGVLSGKDKGEMIIRIDGNDVPLLPGNFQKGSSTALYLYENFLDEDVFEAIARVNKATEDYKLLMLN